MSGRSGWDGLLLALALVSSTGLLAKEIPLQQVHVLAGGDARLPCDVSSMESGDAAQLVLWYREDLGTPVYSMDARGGQLQRWSDQEVLDGRAHFWADRRPAELLIRRALASDAAVYRCRVDFRVAQTRNSRVNLTVIVPPTRLLIEDDAGHRFTSVAGPFSEGDTLHLRCIAFGGSPPPTVQWFREDEPLGTLGVVLPDGSAVRADVTLEGLQRADLNTRLTCQAANTELTAPIEDSVLVDMNLRPLDVRLLGVSQPLSAGRRYDLLCQSSGSRPPARITWWLNGQRQQHSKLTTSVDGNTTTSTLSFVPSKEDDGRFLACQAENPNVYTDVPEDGAKLTIHYAPEVTVSLGPSLDPTDIREGSDVYFDCRIKAQPQAFRVQWLHNGHLLRPGAGVVLSNLSLVLQAVGRAARGNYTCVAFNAEGSGQSRPFPLDVLCHSVAWGHRSDEAELCWPGSLLSTRADIRCEVDANPPAGAFRWAFNSSGGGDELAGSASISYTPHTDLDYGHLLCWAANRVGRQAAACVFHIVPAGRPDKVQNCTVGNVTAHALSLRCAEGFSGGLPQSFLLEVREDDSGELRANLSSGAPTFHVQQLRAGELHHLAVFAYNSKGRSEPVFLAVTTMAALERQLKAGHHGNPLAAAETAGGGSSLMAVWLVLAVLASMVVMGVGIALVTRLLCRSQRHDHPPALGPRGDNGGGAAGAGAVAALPGARPHCVDKAVGGAPPAGAAKLIDPGGADDPDIISHAAYPDFGAQSVHLPTIRSPPPVQLQRRRSEDIYRRTVRISAEKLEVMSPHALSLATSRTSLHAPACRLSGAALACSSETLHVRAHESTV
ncbi:hemicentin-1-like [Schistocerca nitens]|uniref:hemicentin-1-like n=1 Tax=Schistocerca nitens TaxID=7011 RepID=UPI0021182FBC|nr:hemicentin-1-like [Schistocerca nitens]